MSDSDLKAGIYTYPWDLSAEGHDVALGRIAAACLTAVNLACTYHAGRFLLPHNPRRRVYFAEDGALYFQPDPARYDRIQPRVSSLVADDSDPLTAFDRARRAHGLDLVAWVVCLHNTWLGERYPDCAAHNAFGDPYVHSLCPAHPDVRTYLVALVTDIVVHADVAAIELESPGYMRFLHGFHHEVVGVPLDPTQQLLLSLSFNPVELDQARLAGIDGEGVRRWVARLLDDCWANGLKLHDSEGPTEAVRDLFADPDFVSYVGWREEIVTSLAAEIRDAVRHVSPQTEIRHFAPLGTREHDGTHYEGLTEVADGILTGYAQSEGDASRRAGAVRALMNQKRVYGRVRAIAPDMIDPTQIALGVAAWRGTGVDGINFYNYGLMTLPMLSAIGAALRDEG